MLHLQNEMLLGDYKISEHQLHRPNRTTKPTLKAVNFLQSPIYKNLTIRTEYNIFFIGDILCTKICADYTERNLAVENHTENFVKTAFGNNQAPSWQDFENFLDERCVPRNRDGLQYYLDAIGVDEYDPLKIIAVTKGRMAEDDQWIEIVDL